MDMKIKKVIAPQGAQYLNDIAEYANELPDNCLFHKGKTGCGGTTIALKNDLNTIVCVPFRSLIFNKLQESDGYPHEILGICQKDNGKKVTDNEIAEYLKRHTVKKIMTTYDSLPRVIKAIENITEISLDDFRVVVDEYQILFGSYGYRYGAVREVLSNLYKFKHVTCMTATPIQREYLFHELKRFRIEEVYWPEEPKTTVVLKVTNSIIQMVRKEITQSNVETENLHLFVNSVKLIAEIIKLAELTPEATRIVCADNNPSKGKTNQEKLPKGFKVAKITDAVLKYNFYTCCAFEGCDISDENGKTIIVSDAYSSYTLLDIRTSVPQIMGRIRNSRYKYDITHIYSILPKCEEERLEERHGNLSSMLEESESYVNDANRMTEKRNRRKTGKLCESYNRSDEYKYIYWDQRREILQCDRGMFFLEIYNLSIVRKLYSRSILLAYEYLKNGFKYRYDPNGYFEPLKSESDNTESSFRESFKRYASLKESTTIVYCFAEREEDTIARWFPLIPKAYFILGKERVEELNYHQGNIKLEVMARECDSKSQAIKTAFLDSYNYGDSIPLSQVKARLQDIYDAFGLSRSATATQIEEYFTAEIKCKKVHGTTAKFYILSENVLPE